MAAYHGPAQITQGDTSADVYANISGWRDEGQCRWEGWFETREDALELVLGAATLAVPGQLPASITLTRVDLTDPEWRMYEGEFEGVGEPPITLHPDGLKRRSSLFRSIVHWAETRRARQHV